MAVCRHVMHICGGGDEGRSTGHLTIDGSQTRLTYARESARNGPPPARVRDAKGDGNSGFEHAQEGAAHRGLKKTAFGVPEGFYPDQASRVYFLPPTPTLAPTLTLTPTPTLILTLTLTLTLTKNRDLPFGVEGMANTGSGKHRGTISF